MTRLRFDQMAEVVKDRMDVFGAGIRFGRNYPKSRRWMLNQSHLGLGLEVDYRSRWRTSVILPFAVAQAAFLAIITINVRDPVTYVPNIKFGAAATKKLPRPLSYWTYYAGVPAAGFA